MATLIEAVSAFRPRVLHQRTVKLDDLSLRLSRGSLVTRSIARMVLGDLAEEIERALLAGERVFLPGIGRLTTSIRTDGRVHVNISVDRHLARALASPADFKGEVLRRENIGLSAAELVAMWNEAHPDDPVALAA